MGYGLWSTEKNERGESGRRREQTKGRGRLSSECYFRFRVTKKTCYLYFFFLMMAGLNRFGSVRFNRFQTLKTETEPNRIFLVIFQSVNSVFFRFGFFSCFFFSFFGLIGYSVFLLIPTLFQEIFSSENIISLRLCT
jgi:hypothetical protein